jgi:hypothetical protein
MNFDNIKNVFRINELGERRTAQFQHEDIFDNKILPQITATCGCNVSLQLLLARAKLNRVMCMRITEASLMSKMDMYNIFLKETDIFNENINSCVSLPIINCEKMVNILNNMPN